MLRVEDLHHSRRQRASVNHESYKQLLHKLYARIRHRASLDFTEVAYTIPPLIPGRPIYSQAHAARYMTEKLEKGGFTVRLTAADDGMSSNAIHVSWPAAKAKKRKSAAKAHAAKAAAKAAAKRSSSSSSRKTATAATGGGAGSMSERLRELSERLRKL
jgi:hypothetical protein